MKKHIALLAPLAAVAITLAACGSSGPVGSGSGTGRGARSAATTTTAPAATTTTTPTGSTTTAPASPALATAFDDAATLEGTSLATYQAVIARLGSVAPFVNVASSEQQHLSAVQTVASHYGLTVPTAGFSAPATVPSTLTAACQLGVTTEHHVISTYDTLIPQVSAYPDVAQVFNTLQHAAEDSHLPAFEHCS